MSDLTRIARVFTLLAILAACIQSSQPSAPTLGDTWTRPQDGMTMVYVPAGEFRMGSDIAEVDRAYELCQQHIEGCRRWYFENEQPSHSVYVEGFWIDQTEVTNRQYQQCVNAAVCTVPETVTSNSRDNRYESDAFADHPVTHVTWKQATRYCNWVKGRLPTEAEWEYAARGRNSARFPWGNDFDTTALNYCDANCQQSWADTEYDDAYADTAPVGSFPAGASWIGAMDLAGNVSEWTSTNRSSYPYHSDDRREDQTPGYIDRVIRGGSYSSFDVRCSLRGSAQEYESSSGLGFRCVCP